MHEISTKNMCVHASRAENKGHKLLQSWKVTHRFLTAFCRCNLIMFCPFATCTDCLVISHLSILTYDSHFPSHLCSFLVCLTVQCYFTSPVSYPPVLMGVNHPTHFSCHALHFVRKLLSVQCFSISICIFSLQLHQHGANKFFLLPFALSFHSACHM